jgi:chemotaxis protein methyltransferase CheR
MHQQQELFAIRNQLGLLFGLNFTESQGGMLVKNLQNAAAELGLSTDLSAIKSWLSKKSFLPEESNMLAKYLTIGETYFFREKAALQLFTEKIIPDLIAKNKPIKIWSAGCSSGEEPYSGSTEIAGGEKKSIRQRLETPDRGKNLHQLCL